MLTLVISLPLIALLIIKLYFMKAKFLFYCILTTLFYSCKNDCNCKTCPEVKTEEKLVVLTQNDYLTEPELIYLAIQQDEKNLDVFIKNSKHLSAKEIHILKNKKDTLETRNTLIQKILTQYYPKINLTGIRGPRPVPPCLPNQECCPDYIALNKNVGLENYIIEIETGKNNLLNTPKLSNESMNFISMKKRPFNLNFKPNNFNDSFSVSFKCN